MHSMRQLLMIFIYCGLFVRPLECDSLREFTKVCGEPHQSTPLSSREGGVLPCAARKDVALSIISLSVLLADIFLQLERAISLLRLHVRISLQSPYIETTYKYKIGRNSKGEKKT